ncbi:hypothetical protein F5Y18DRAFT_194425 [Xylariaceae sp. FL1019]|nr:hypothetical protein F5Y18DRAFT_194425 [Xylariaceae sp. FL1019]
MAKKSKNKNKNKKKNANKAAAEAEAEASNAHLRFGEMSPVSISRPVPRAAPAVPTSPPSTPTTLSTGRVHTNTTPIPLRFGDAHPVSTSANTKKPTTSPLTASPTMAPSGTARVNPPAAMTPEISSRIEAMTNLFSPSQWHLLPNLDDPCLVQKVLSRPLGPPGTCSVSFSALPQHDPKGFTADLSKFGTVLIENHQRLAIRMKHSTMDMMLNFVRQVWVSKYLTPFHPCSITFDLPDATGLCNVVMQRVNPPSLHPEVQGLNGNMARLSVVAEEDENPVMPATNAAPIFRASAGHVNDNDFVDNNDVMTWPCRSPIPEDDEDKTETTETSDGGEESSVEAVRQVSTPQPQEYCRYGLSNDCTACRTPSR